MNKDKINFLLKGNAILLGVFILYFFINFGSGFEIADDLFDTDIWFVSLFALLLFPIMIARSFFPIVFIISSFNMLCVSFGMKIIDFLNECTLKKVLLYIALGIYILMLLGLLLYFGIWSLLSFLGGSIFIVIICLCIFITLVVYLILSIKKCFFK